MNHFVQKIPIKEHLAYLLWLIKSRILANKVKSEPTKINIYVYSNAYATYLSEVFNRVAADLRHISMPYRLSNFHYIKIQSAVKNDMIRKALQSSEQSTVAIFGEDDIEIRVTEHVDAVIHGTVFKVSHNDPLKT